MVEATKCTNHCSLCGRHFHSTQAFDAHRRGKYMPKPGQRGRRCIAPEDAADANGGDLFIVLTDNGSCSTAHENDITIWTLRASYQGAFNRRSRGGRSKRRRIKT